MTAEIRPKKRKKERKKKKKKIKICSTKASDAGARTAQILRVEGTQVTSAVTKTAMDLMLAGYCATRSAKTICTFHNFSSTSSSSSRKYHCVEPWLMLVGKRVYDFLFVIIELCSLAHTDEALQGKTCQDSLLSAGGRSVCAKISGGRNRLWGILFWFLQS